LFQEQKISKVTKGPLMSISRMPKSWRPCMADGYCFS